HNQKLIAIDFDFGAAVFRNEDLVPFLDGEIHLLALLVHLTGAESDHFAFLRFFFRSIGNDDPAFFCFLLFERLHQHPISERSYINCCHKLLSLLWFVVVPAARKSRSHRQIVVGSLYRLCEAARRLTETPYNPFVSHFRVTIRRLLFLVLVDDFELRINDVALFTCAFFRAAAGLRFRPGLRTWTWTGTTLR